jgi:peptidoglycan hydrolase CwlO-like protein
MNKEKVIAATATILLVLSLIGTGLYYRSNNSLKSGLDDEKLKAESLLSEKLALAKEAEKLKNDILSWQGKSAESDKILADAMDKITNMEKTINGLRKENATVTSLKKELSDLKQIRKDLETQIANLDQQHKQKAQEIDDMTAELNSLKSKQNELIEEIKALQANVTDDFRLETTRGKKNEKLTVKAAKTKKLTVSFEIPQNMSDDVKFSIVTPAGKKINSDDKSLTYNFIDDGRNLTASLSPYSGEFEISRRIEMTYTPDKKLEAGIYKIKILHKDANVGSCQIKLK